MNALSRVVLAGATACCAAGSAHAVFIDFDSPLPAGISIAYFDNPKAPLAALPVTLAESLQYRGSAIANSGQALLLRWDTINFGSYGALFRFDTPLASFSAIGNDFGGAEVDDNEIVFLTAFDAAGAVIATSTTHEAYARPNLQHASIAAPGIAAVAFSFSTDLGFYMVDNVVASVPEPQTAALMAFGVAALAFVHRRRRKAG